MLIDQRGASNERSWAYLYDGLQRLVDAQMGVISGGGGGIFPGPVSHTFGWELDSLGNWVGDGQRPGFEQYTLYSGGAEELSGVTHAVDPANRIQSQTVETDPNNPVTVDFVYDGDGNLVFDGQYFYQYDGFNRLIEIRSPAALTSDDFDPNIAPLVLDPNSS